MSPIQSPLALAVCPMPVRHQHGFRIEQVVGHVADLEPSHRSTFGEKKGVEALCLDPMIPPAGAGLSA